MNGRRRRNRLEKLTPLQLRARRDKDKAEELTGILIAGIHKRFENFYGDADDITDMIDIININLGNAVVKLKAAEIYYKKVMETKKKIKEQIVEVK